jgi:hypothetical protein
MKSILYVLIAVFVFGIIAAGIPYTRNSSKTITIQTIGNNVSQADLNQSANIIANRLKSFSSERFDLNVNTEKSQIQVKLSNKWDLNSAAALIFHKGSLGFFETYNLKELKELLGANNQIFSLLKSNPFEFQVGCTNLKNTEKVIEYVKSLGLIQNCMFVWGPVSENSEVCLYALKPDNNIALMSGGDIEAVSSKKSQSKDNYEIDLKFKELAANKWSTATKQNINRSIAIVLDGTVICAPIVRSEINNGLCTIAGNYSKTEASAFVSILQNGELPVDYKIVK